VIEDGMGRQTRLDAVCEQQSHGQLANRNFAIIDRKTKGHFFFFEWDSCAMSVCSSQSK
jgi:hypothetical protein